MLFNKVDYISKEKASVIWNLMFDNGAIHVKTEEEAKDLLFFFHGLGYSWSSGCSLLGSSFHQRYAENTYYRINNQKRFLFGDITHPNTSISNIIPYSPSLLKRWEKLKKEGTI